MRLKLTLLFIALAVFFTAGYLTAENGQWRDGVYEGEHSFVKVEVEVSNGNITDIRMLRHGGGGKKYADMVSPIIDEIIENQSVEADTITGATVSSNNIKQAVQEALAKARPD